MAFTDRVEFTKEMKKEGYTILAPNMAPIHFRLFENLFASYGYNVEILQTRGRQIVDEGLKYVHNDTCYPALLTIGQMMDALHSGKYDLHKTALIITQTGGGCRASNYIHLLRKALEKDGLSYITATHDRDNPRSGGVMRNAGMKYRYSYEEQWQPKNIPVIFRMYQLNFDGDEERVYQKYRDISAVHFVETDL